MLDSVFLRNYPLVHANAFAINILATDLVVRTQGFSLETISAANALVL